MLEILSLGENMILVPIFWGHYQFGFLFSTCNNLVLTITY